MRRDLLYKMSINSETHTKILLEKHLNQLEELHIFIRTYSQTFFIKKNLLYKNKNILQNFPPLSFPNLTKLSSDTLLRRLL